MTHPTTNLISSFLIKYREEFIQIRRRLHQLAELSTLEYETGHYLMELLNQWNIPYEYPVAETGLIATIEGQSTSHVIPTVTAKQTPGIAGMDSSIHTPKVIALRADMDALPIFESPVCPYASQNPGVMHACGHDAHMTIALGVAKFFKENEKNFSGCIRIFFQPAEETIGGASRMIQEGCMQHPKVDYVLGLHVAPYLETGTIQVKYDKFYAASDEISILLHGKSCHGAYPDQGIDTIAMAAQFISSLQTIVSRNASPLDQCVLTLGTIRGGTAHNIIADTVELTGALRTTSPDTREYVKKLLQQQLSGICHAFGGSGTLTVTPGYDALINTNTLVDLLIDTAIPILGKENILFKESPGMGVEDFSHFLKEAPGVFYHLGCGNKKKGITAPLHSPNFALDEDSLALGIYLQIALVNALLA